MKTTGKILTVTAVTLALAGAGFAGIRYNRFQQVPVDGINYRKGSTPLDLRQETITLQHYLNLREAFPDRTILWNVPFQQRAYDCTTEKITITSLRKEDVEALTYLEQLQEIDASNCFDYEALALLRETLPDCRILSYVALDERILPWDTRTLEFQKGRGDFEELQRKLIYLPELETVRFEEPSMTAEELKRLQQLCPQVQFSWTKQLFGSLLSSDTEELDISGMKFESVEEIEAQTDFLPNLKTLTMCDTGLADAEIAAYRERSRSRFKVIWNVRIRDFDVRTDARWFYPAKFGKEVRDCDMRHLKYCEDMLYVDLSRMVVKNMDWAWGTPHLQYLVITESPLRDIQPLRTLKELKLLDLRKVDLRDMRPLADCTALEDLNVAGNYPDLETLGKMDWLHNLWVYGSEEELGAMLPDTVIHSSSREGWKQLENYKEMQKILQMQGPVLIKKQK